MAISYISIGSNDLERSRRFYTAVLPLIGAETGPEMPGAFSFRLRDGVSIWVGKPFNKNAAVPSNGGMIAFDSVSEDDVCAAHAAALAHGGADEGAPGPRPQYGPEFFGSYVRDPDGNKLCFVFRRKVPIS
jgi:catechol 2,3-dioxygenase-like lactoylglutathione lyase family enzyme